MPTPPIELKPLLQLPEETVIERIRAARAELGDRLLILGHHYQQDAIIQFADLRGDSYVLAKKGSTYTEADYIVFCGVHFMAESADILAADHQQVILPDMRAGCTMADMANLDDVEVAWDEIQEHAPGKTIPITYMNSAANLKAFCGRHEGAVCTSSNAEAIIRDAFDRGDRLLFFPDQHLGRNVCYAMGYELDEMLVWDPHEYLGGNTPEAIERAKVFLWKGHCSVHQGFKPQHIDYWREEKPDIKILVHPECAYEVVQKADMAGSTKYIIEQITASEPGSAWAIGTEIHLVNRLKQEFPDRFITSLSPYQCLCATMYRIRPPYLLWVLENLLEGTVVNRIKVGDAVARDARLALDRMIEVTTRLGTTTPRFQRREVAEATP